MYVLLMTVEDKGRARESGGLGRKLSQKLNGTIYNRQLQTFPKNTADCELMETSSAIQCPQHTQNYQHTDTEKLQGEREIKREELDSN
jgi:hypothetical protein